MGELRLEGREVLIRGEVVLRLRPGRGRVDDAVDQLLHAVLAARLADVAAEVLADDDVGGQLAPERRDLHVLLFEDGLAGFVADGRGPNLPGDIVVRVDAGAAPAALEREALRRPSVLVQPVKAHAALATAAPGPPAANPPC